MDLEEEIKKFSLKDDFFESLNEDEKKNYLFITRAYFLNKEKKDLLIKAIKENKDSLIGTELELINRYNDFFVDELRNYSVGEGYRNLKKALNDDRMHLVKYINLMNEYDLTYEEELDFNRHIINEYLCNHITFDEELEDLMNLIEETYE